MLRLESMRDVVLPTRALANSIAAPILKACNWAAGTFCFAGIGAYEFFLQKRFLEKKSMARAVEIMDRKKLEKEREREEKRKERRLRKEEHDREVEERSRQSSSWFWSGKPKDN